MAKAKTKTAFFCKSCGAESPKWFGKCPACNEWNTCTEQVLSTATKAKPDWRAAGDSRKPKPEVRPRKVSEISTDKTPRIPTGDAELDRVLGGGIVPGSMVLIGGEPGIGKSTLMLQIAMMLKDLKVLYVSAEESDTQIKMRADRLKHQSEECLILNENTTQSIFKQVEQVEPELLVIDSIQTLYSSNIDSAAGSVGQVRECAAELLQYAKESNTPVFMIGHITKDGSLAGPKTLEHMVDTVLQFEGDRNTAYRIVRTIKNRFGSTSELGIYEMRESGLRQVSNPSEILISQKDEHLSGVAIAASQEGNRPLLIEIQALVSRSAYGTPQRASTGFDGKRLNMLLAVLEKRFGYRIGGLDVFLNIAGGLKVDDPAVDLAICSALVSSFQEKPIPYNVCFAGEVGLGGEVRAVNRIEHRIVEAQKLGFKGMVISKYNKLPENFSPEIRILQVGKVGEVFDKLFG